MSLSTTIALPSQTRLRVFISYARKDATTHAIRLKADLASNGFKAWSDAEMTGGVFGSVLQKAIDESFAMLAILSPDAVESYWVKAEWLYALSKKTVTIIPVVVPEFDEQRFPLVLFPLARIYIKEDDYAESLKRMCELLEQARLSPPVW